VPDPAAPIPAPMSPLNAPDSPIWPDCQLMRESRNAKEKPIAYSATDR
jgi:hypothetical protein